MWGTRKWGRSENDSESFGGCDNVVRRPTCQATRNFLGLLTACVYRISQELWGMSHACPSMFARDTWIYESCARESGDQFQTSLKQLVRLTLQVEDEDAASVVEEGMRQKAPTR